MGLVTGALQIGRSALLAYQSALQVVGNNISNAGNTGYTRQTPVTSPISGIVLPEGFLPGGGVALTALQRNVDSSLDSRLSLAKGDQSDAVAQQDALARIESAMNELSDTDLSTLLQSFFNAFRNLQTTPHDSGARSTVLTAGTSVVQEIQRQRQDVLSLRDELNTQIQDSVRQVNSLTQDIARLNGEITVLESSNKANANALRDQRDEVVRQLSEIVRIQTREQPNGGINVYLGNELLVTNTIHRDLTTTLETTEDGPRSIVQFADNNREVSLMGGSLAGTVTARDTHVLGYLNALNYFAQAMANEVNKIHAGGQGLRGFGSLTGAVEVGDPAAVLNSDEADLNLTPQNGSFMLYVNNTQSQPPTRVATTIEVDLNGVGQEETLQSLAAKIDAVDHVTASVTADQRLKITMDSGYEVTFGEDTSGVLAALGINTFFTGSGANDLAVNSALVENPDLIAAATRQTAGDGSNAGLLADLATQALESLGGKSVTELYNGIVSDIAVKGKAASASVQSAGVIVSSLTSQRESISGVSLDEEAISLMRFERSYQAAARYTTVVDRLIEQTLGIIE